MNTPNPSTLTDAQLESMYDAQVGSDYLNTLPRITGERHNDHISASLPLSPDWWAQGEFTAINSVSRKHTQTMNDIFVAVAQDLDGKCYLVEAN